MTKDTGGPAFPSQDSVTLGDMKLRGEAGMTLRQYAAIKLRVPDSGLDWLDEMIRKSARDDFAAKAMQAIINKDGPIHIMREDGVTEVHTGRRIIPVLSYQYADAMLAERAK